MIPKRCEALAGRSVALRTANARGTNDKGRSVLAIGAAPSDIGDLAPARCRCVGAMHTPEGSDDAKE